MYFGCAARVIHVVFLCVCVVVVLGFVFFHIGQWASMSLPYLKSQDIALRSHEFPTLSRETRTDATDGVTKDHHVTGSWRVFSV